MGKAFAHRVTFTFSVLYQHLDVALRVGGDHATNFIERSVLAVSFDEENFEVIAELRQPRDRRFDVAALVAARHEHRGRPSGPRSRARRPGDDVIAQAGPPDDGPWCDVPVDKRAQPQEAFWNQLAPLTLDYIEIGELQQAGDVVGR